MGEEEIGRTLVRMEEEEEEGWEEPIFKRRVGFTRSDDARDDETPSSRPVFEQAYGEFLQSMAQERTRIIDDEKMTAKEKRVLLDENRKMLVVANGGTVRKTDSVVYGILIFGGVVLIVLSLLTVFAGLPPEVTLAFVGTVLGGTIATIAQKLGKI